VSPTAHQTLRERLAREIPVERLVTDPLRRLAWGTDASFYRLVPELIVVLETEAELVSLLGHARELKTPLTFRAAGTSLSGQAVSDSVLVMLGDGWRGWRIGAGGWTISLQPGVIGAQANRRLAPLQRKIGPDPASIDAAMIGGIAANNASGMCCGTAQNSYRTLDSMRVVLADGRVLDSADPASRAAFARQRPELLAGLARLAAEVKADEALAARIRHKFRLKNTCGYSLNALVDFDDPIDILIHLMIGSEGTLGFISEITYRTVPDHPHKASALILFDDLATACRAVTLLKSQPVDAVELADRAALRSVQGKPGLPAALAEVGEDGAALLVETRAADAALLRSQIAALEATLAAVPTHAFRPTPPSARATGRCARACSRRSARCAPPARR
jgi:D-lactate dehydrogenase